MIWLNREDEWIDYFNSMLKFLISAAQIIFIYTYIFSNAHRWFSLISNFRLRVWWWGTSVLPWRWWMSHYSSHLEWTTRPKVCDFLYQILLPSCFNSSVPKLPKRRKKVEPKEGFGDCVKHVEKRKGKLESFILMGRWR